MPSIVLKLLASMVSLVVMPFILLLVAISTGFDGFFTYIPLVLTPVFIAVWIMIWHRDVKWTKRRTVRTLTSSILAVFMAVLIGIAPYAANGFSHLEGAIFWIGWSYYYLWLAGILVCWRESNAERNARLNAGPTSTPTILCPNCRYNMTGLREAKCPECGSTFTLDQLHRAWQPDHTILSEPSTHP
jgi:hypothetical protein